MPWWQLQPDVQYVFNPGGGIVSPNNPRQSIKNEWVIGLCTNITFQPSSDEKNEGPSRPYPRRRASCRVPYFVSE
jgi:hypothetical protein